MQKYECAVVYNPGIATDIMESSSKKYTDLITAQGGSVTGHDDWGKRSLAYEIDHHREGFYHFYRFEGEGAVVKELNRQLRIDENVLRHMVVRDDYVPPPPRENAPSDEREGDRDGYQKR